MQQKFYVLLILLAISILALNSQNELKNGITKPNILSTHPLGNLFMRGQGNFKGQASKKTIINLSLESGNVWASPIKAYIPLDNDIRAIIKERVWHTAEFVFDEDTLNAQSIDLKFDGVIKGIKASITFPIANKHELILGIRSYILTKGKLPFTSITGDDFVEFFHDKVAGGEDPFARKLFGLNQAKIYYKDRNENILSMDNGDFFVGGFEVNYYYYPNIFDNKTFNINIGSHLGTNLSKYNSSLDLGASINALKNYTVNKKSYFNLGIGIGGIRKSIIELQSNNIDTGNNMFVGYLETALEFNTTSKGGTIHSFGTDFYLQTSLNNKDEFDYLIPIRNGVSEKSWFNGIWHLYKNNNYWTLMYSFTKKITTTFYLQQDLTVNNNPDIQTGISIAFGI